MANEQNLIPFTERSESEVREMNRRGGIASGEARREKREFREFAKIVLDELVKDKKSGEQIPTRYAALKAVLKRVLKDGDHNALKTIAQMANEWDAETNSNVTIVNNYNGISAEAADALNHIDEL
jgi:hypothetical protein